MKSIHAIILLLGFLGFSTSCDMFHSRECSAFYYDYNEWQAIAENDTIKFLTTNNQEVHFNLVEKKISEPYTEGYIGGNCCENEPQTIMCTMAGTFFYQSVELGIDMQLEFQQREQFNQPIEDQLINYRVSFKEDTSTQFTSLHGFQIQPNYDTSSFPNIYSTYDSLILNGNKYYDAIQSEIDTNVIQMNDRFSFYKLIAARKKGIIYLLDKNGNEYFLKD